MFTRFYRKLDLVYVVGKKDRRENKNFQYAAINQKLNSFGRKSSAVLAINDISADFRG